MWVLDLVCGGTLLIGYVHRECQAFDLGGRMLKIVINRLPMPLGTHQIFSTCLDIGRHPPQRRSLCPARHKESDGIKSEGGGQSFESLETTSHHPQEIINTSRLGKQLSTNWPLSRLCERSLHVWGRCFMGGCALRFTRPPGALVQICDFWSMKCFGVMVYVCGHPAENNAFCLLDEKEHKELRRGFRQHTAERGWPLTTAWTLGRTVFNFMMLQAIVHTHARSKSLPNSHPPDAVLTGPYGQEITVTLPCLLLTLD